MKGANKSKSCKNYAYVKDTAKPIAGSMMKGAKSKSCGNGAPVKDIEKPIAGSMLKEVKRFEDRRVNQSSEQAIDP